MRDWEKLQNHKRCGGMEALELAKRIVIVKRERERERKA